MALSISGSGTIQTSSGQGISLQPALTERIKADPTNGQITLSGEYRLNPPSLTTGGLGTPYTTANRTNVESVVVPGYQGTSGTASFNGIPSTGVHYMKKFFNMNSTAGGTFNQTLVELDGRNVNFHELWIKIVWGTRIQGISDSSCAMNERAYGCNKFNGQLINYSIANSWSHIDSNSDTYMDINVVNSPTTGMLLVQYQEASAVTGSSFIWGYIEMMSIETMSDANGNGSVTVKFNC